MAIDHASIGKQPACLCIYVCVDSVVCVVGFNVCFCASCFAFAVYICACVFVCLFFVL